MWDEKYEIWQIEDMRTSRYEIWDEKYEIWKIGDVRNRRYEK